jgi:poly(hydroxyalkanoate) depolymerase family esterase
MTRTRLCSIAVAFVLLTGAAVLPASAATKHGSFTKHRFIAADRGLSRDYWIYRPSRLSARRVPLIVYLHGCTETAHDAALATRWNDLAEKKGFIAVYPDQRIDQTLDGDLASHGNGIGCWNWYNPDDQKRGSGETATIAGITRQVMSSYPIDARRVYVMGPSAGADMTVNMGAAYPDLFAAIGVLAGCPYASCTDLDGSGAYAQMGLRARVMPLFAVQSTTDNLNPLALGAAMVQQWLGTDDLADDGSMNGSISRTPASSENHGVDSSALAGVGTPGDICARPQHWGCPGGALGFKGSYPYTVQRFLDARGRSLVDFWIIHGATHAYPDGDPNYGWTDPLGPNVTKAAYEFFMAHPMEGRRK